LPLFPQTIVITAARQASAGRQTGIAIEVSPSATSAVSPTRIKEVGFPNMRRYLLAGIVAGFMVIVSPSTGQSNPDQAVAERSPFAVQQLISQSAGLRDEAAMVLVGGGLFVLAALVRRAA
jgi:hypothetical protein